MILINIMISLASILFYIILSQFHFIDNIGVAFFLSIVLAILANGPQFLKVEMYKNSPPSFLSRIAGLCIVIFMLGISLDSYLSLWNNATEGIEKVFLGWMALLGLFILYVPLTAVSKFDKKIARKIENSVGMSNE